MGMRQMNGMGAGSLIDVSCEDLEVTVVRFRAAEERQSIHLHGQVFPSNNQHRPSQCGCQIIYYIHHLDIQLSITHPLSWTHY